ncbi:MAG: phosphatase PAP2 family protein [Chloroflexota bacterium]|nr:phosphatase PAP2 family protein [Chloroflexota bacterium]
MTLKELLSKDVQLSRQIAIPENRKTLRRAAAFFAHSGDSWFWIGGLALLRLAGPHAWRPKIDVYLLGILVTAVSVMVLKFSIKRPRPTSEWGAIYRKTDPHSFPSGHATRAAMLAVLGIVLGPPWLGVLLTLWAPLVGLARISLGVHYISDVAVGGGLGIIFGSLVGWLGGLLVL